MSSPLLNVLQSYAVAPDWTSLSALLLLLPLAIPQMVQGALVLLLLMLVLREARIATLCLVLGVPLCVIGVVIAAVVMCFAILYGIWTELQRLLQEMERTLSKCCKCISRCLHSRVCCWFIGQLLYAFESVLCGLVVLACRLLMLACHCSCCDDPEDLTAIHTEEPRQRWEDTGDVGFEDEGEAAFTESNDFEVIVTDP